MKSGDIVEVITKDNQSFCGEVKTKRNKFKELELYIAGYNLGKWQSLYPFIEIPKYLKNNYWNRFFSKYPMKDVRGIGKVLFKINNIEKIIIHETL